MKSNAQRVRDHRGRKKAMRLFSDVSSAVQKKMAGDMKFSLSHNEKGNIVVDWDMDKATETFLKGYAAAKGLTFDELMDFINRAVLAIHKEQPKLYQQVLYDTAKKTEEGKHG